MSTKFAEIFAALAAPFPASEVKTRVGGGNRQLAYITARTAMIRLDEVCGPENWSDRYYEVCEVLFCEITITLPDGTKVSKADAGGFKQMMEKGQVDEENTDKTGPSDAFKRAAAKWGIGRYLYKDGVADFHSEPTDSHPQNNSGHGRGEYASPSQVSEYGVRLKGFLDKFNAQFLDQWTTREGLVEGIREPISTWNANGHLVKWAVATGKLDGRIIPEDCKPNQKDRYVAIVFHRDPASQKALIAELNSYARKEAHNEALRWRSKHPDAAPVCAGFEELMEAEQEEVLDGELVGAEPGSKG